MKYMVLILLVALYGCADSRIKSEANLLNVKTQTASKEYVTAATPQDKDAIASEYFRTAPKMTQLISDYMRGVPPTPAPLPIPVPAPVPAPPPVP
jgi:hypothetical protein